jgi:hypothetical protein
MTNTTQRPSDLLKQQPLLIAVVAFMVGLVIGLVVLGWWLWPVEWTDASIADLQPADKQEYVRLVAANYALQPDSTRAGTMIARLGENAPQVISDTLGTVTGEDAIRVAQLRAVLESSGLLEPAGGGGTTPDGGQASLLDQFRVPLLACTVLVLLLLAAAGVWYAINTGALKRFSAPRPAGGGAGTGPRVRGGAGAPPKANFDAGPTAPSPTGTQPVVQFMTTYVLGDDLYDDSFSIDAQDGSFLGECGMGISETIGVGDPKKVMAFEVWLFDKNDIRTVTKVLMSEHAFRDEALKSRLAAKGEPVLVQQGDVVQMETASLVVTARVVDMAYGGGALPPNSYFERLTIELAAYSKNHAPAAA